MSDALTARKGASPEESLLTELARDLSTCTADELKARWDEPAQRAIDKISAKRNAPSFAERLIDHNPLYYLAERVFFNRVRKLPNYLHPPFHRDWLARKMLDYYLDESAASVGIVLLAPRNTFKSAFAHGAMPLFAALRAKHLQQRDLRILMLHHKIEMSTPNLTKLKSKAVAHPWLRRVWPEFCFNETTRKHGAKTFIDWPCKVRGEFAEHSVLASGMGASQTGGHFDLICLDDMVTEEHLKSKQVREECAIRYDALGYTKETVGGKLLITGTPYHLHDQYTRLEKAEMNGTPMYEFHRLAAQEDDGTLNIPSRWPADAIKRTRQEAISKPPYNDIMFQLQVLCRIPKEAQLAADASWLRYCKESEIDPRGWRVLFIDPAWKGDKNHGEGDFASIQVWSLERKGGLVIQTLVDGVHSNEFTQSDGLGHIFRLMRLHGVVDVAPEERGGYGFRQQLKNEAVTRGQFINVIDLKSMQRSKQARIVQLLGKFQAGQCFISEGCDPILSEAFRDQFVEYPQVEHDDALDCAAYTCDGGILENYSPRFVQTGTAAWLRPPQPVEPPRTRYSPT